MAADDLCAASAWCPGCKQNVHRGFPGETANCAKGGPVVLEPRHEVEKPEGSR